MQPKEYTSEQVAIVRESYGRLRLIAPTWGAGYVSVFERVVDADDSPVYENAVRILTAREKVRRPARKRRN